MERRQTRRKAHRVPVRFWLRGEASAPRRGFTTDLSPGGMHLATSSVCPSQTRLRVEVGKEGSGFVVEGVVAHSRRIAPELRKLGLSGMGVRFLGVEELVSELLGAAAWEDESGEGPGAEEGFYRLRFDSPEQFLRAVRNDVAHGGLFVPTREPAALERTVTIEVVPPVEGLRPVRLSARVVQRIEPAAEGERPNLLAGMGVQLDDPGAARKSLASAVAALAGRPAD
jgi:hypothetical protein